MSPVEGTVTLLLTDVEGSTPRRLAAAVPVTTRAQLAAAATERRNGQAGQAS